jgi:hypothetical protein
LSKNNLMSSIKRLRGRFTQKLEGWWKELESLLPPFRCQP